MLIEFITYQVRLPDEFCSFTPVTNTALSRFKAPNSKQHSQYAFRCFKHQILILLILPKLDPDLRKDEYLTSILTIFNHTV